MHLHTSRNRQNAVMKERELREKVALLRDGQIVEIQGDYFQAARIPDYWDESPCNVCELDSICRDDVNDVCNELDIVPPWKWLLKLAHRTPAIH